MSLLGKGICLAGGLGREERRIQWTDWLQKNKEMD